MNSCIIIDDEAPARALISEYVKKLPHLKLLGEYKNPMEAYDVLNKSSVDIIFLDIQMPGMTGLEFIKTLSNKPKIIITTAYSEYALDGYDLDVIDYLMKPISFERFVRAVNKCTSNYGTQNIVGEQKTLKRDYMLVKADRQTHKVYFKDILYIEGLKEYVSFMLENERIIALETMKSLEAELPHDSFMRIHKSFIVNTTRVKSLSGNQVQIGDKKIPIGQSYREKVLNDLF
ncbi:MAG: LytTR family DNA-binding domain-containing protein [Cyclobacteriaceae bacterium]